MRETVAQVDRWSDWARLTPPTMKPPDTPSPLPLAAERCERTDAAANRERVLLAARQLFSERGAAGVSMDAVAVAAGVGKGTVFRRFGDRAGLTEALLDEEMRAFQEEFLHGPPPLGPAAPAARRLEAFVCELLVVLDRNIELVVAADLSSTHPPRLFDALALHLRILLAEVAPTRNSEVLADLLLSALSASMLRRLRRDRGYALSEIQASVGDLLRGVIAPR